MSAKITKGGIEMPPEDKTQVIDTSKPPVQAIEQAAKEAALQRVGQIKPGEYLEIASESNRLLIMCDKHGILHAWSVFQKVI